VGVAHDGGEVAVAEAGDAAAGVRAEAALSVAEVLEGVATEGAHEGFARAIHGVLGVDGFEEEAHGALLGAGSLALLLDDGAEGIGVLALERMGQVPAAGDVDAEEDGEKEGGERLGEVGLT